MPAGAAADVDVTTGVGAERSEHKLIFHYCLSVIVGYILVVIFCNSLSKITFAIYFVNHFYFWNSLFSRCHK